MTAKKIALSLALLFMLSTLTAQQTLIERADRLYEEMSYPDAIVAYKKILEKDKKDKHSVLRLADCYRKINDTRKAYSYYARAVKFKNIDPLVYFHYGQILMINRKYERAIPWFQKYAQYVPDDSRAYEMIASCKNLGSFKEEARLFNAKPLSLNSEASDFGPVFYGDAVVFASSRKRQLLRKYARTGQSFLDLYIAPYDGSRTLGEPELFRGRINTPFHEATACFSTDGKEMFFTKNNVVKGKLGTSKEGVVNLATFRSVMVEGKWQDAEPLSFNSEEYSVGHPCLSPDGKRLYFVSNMPGGEGATDLYFADRNGDSWGQPVNMGPEINTKGNEMFPWMDAEGVLYFASNGHQGQGGLDILYASPVGEGFGKPINYGAPINSAQDDFGFIYDSKNKIGFFTTNRPGGKGDDDLWYFEKLIPLTILVKDEAGKPVPDAVIVAKTGRAVLRLGTNAEGKFVYGMNAAKDYKFYAKKVGYKDVEIEISTKGEQGDEAQEVNVVLETVAE